MDKNIVRQDNFFVQRYIDFTFGIKVLLHNCVNWD